MVLVKKLLCCYLYKMLIFTFLLLKPYLLELQSNNKFVIHQIVAPSILSANEHMYAWFISGDCEQD